MRFKRFSGPFCPSFPSQSGSADALQRFQSASWRRSRLVGRPCSSARAGSGREPARPLERLARRQTLGRFLVERPGRWAPGRGRPPDRRRRPSVPVRPGAGRSGRRRAPRAPGLAGCPLTATRPLPMPRPRRAPGSCRSGRPKATCRAGFGPSSSPGRASAAAGLTAQKIQSRVPRDLEPLLARRQGRRTVGAQAQVAAVEEVFPAVAEEHRGDQRAAGPCCRLAPAAMRTPSRRIIPVAASSPPWRRPGRGPRPRAASRRRRAARRRRGARRPCPRSGCCCP